MHLFSTEKLQKTVKNHLNKNGLFSLKSIKIGKRNTRIFKNFQNLELVKDLSGNDRFVLQRK